MIQLTTNYQLPSCFPLGGWCSPTAALHKCPEVSPSVSVESSPRCPVFGPMGSAIIDAGGNTHSKMSINQSINQSTHRNIWISYVDAMWRLESSSSYLLLKFPIFKLQQYTHSTLCIACLWCLSACGPTSHCGQIGPTNPLKIKDANFPSTTVLGYLDVFGSTTLHFFTSPCR